MICSFISRPVIGQLVESFYLLRNMLSRCIGLGNLGPAGSGDLTGDVLCVFLSRLLHCI